jgi:hypothetical protein
MTDTLAAATAYTQRGWRLVPIEAGTKRPPLHMTGWQDLRLDADDLPQHFGNGAGVGVLCGSPSGGLVDIDLDSAEALRLAAAFLPKTALRHGRPGRPNSHSWFQCSPLPDTVKFQDGNGMLVEFRGTGAQTVLPPSPHPDGGAYEWTAEGQPTLIDGRDLLAAVSRLAAAALLARHWPAQGSRQDAALALAGGLLRAGWEEDTVSHFVQSVATAAGDEEARQRAVAGRYSAKRLNGDRPATGWPTLAQLVGADVADKAAEWLGIRWDAGETPVVFGSETAPTEWPQDAVDEAFSGLAGDVVRTIAPHSEADPHAVLLTSLAAFGSAAGPEPHFMVGQTRHGLRLNVVIVASTGQGRKGTSLEEVRGIYRRASPEWADGCITSGLSSGEGLIHEVRDPTEKQEPVKEGGKITGYQTVTTDEGVTDKRRLVIESEFARTLRVMNRDGNILSTVIRQAWDSDTLRTLTKFSPLRATGAHIGILAHITEEDLKRHLDGTEAANGFGNRFIWQVARRSQFLPDGGSVPAAELDALAERLSEALDFAQCVGELRRDTEARDMWHAVYEDLSKGKPGLAGALLGRAEAQTMRLACVYALLDLSDVVRGKHLLASLALWERAEASVRYIFGDATGDPVADTIMSALRAQGELSQTAIRDLFSRNVKADRIARALSILAEAGLVASETAETGGRPSTTWRAL